jgi:hypothetical protein
MFAYVGCSSAKVASHVGDGGKSEELEVWILTTKEGAAAAVLLLLLIGAVEDDAAADVLSAVPCCCTATEGRDGRIAGVDSTNCSLRTPAAVDVVDDAAAGCGGGGVVVALSRAATPVGATGTFAAAVFATPFVLLCKIYGGIVRKWTPDRHVIESHAC